VTYSAPEIRRWGVAAVGDAAGAVDTRAAAAGAARDGLTDGTASLVDGWSGVAADAVSEAADRERSQVAGLHDDLAALAETLRRAEDALAPAVAALRECLTEAENSGLVVEGTGDGGALVRPMPWRQDVDDSVVNGHAEAIGAAVATVRSLDHHYGREIDGIAALLYRSIPPEVDRSPIPGPDDPGPGRAVDAVTGAMRFGFGGLADDLDPETRGKHMLNPVPDDFGRVASTGLRGLGRFAGPLGSGLTVYDGVESYSRGEATAGEAVAGTGGALAGGLRGGFAAGALLGSSVGPLGTIIGAGIGAALGSFLGQKMFGAAYDVVFDNGE